MGGLKGCQKQTTHCGRFAWLIKAKREGVGLPNQRTEAQLKQANKVMIELPKRKPWGPLIPEHKRRFDLKTRDKPVRNPFVYASHLGVDLGLSGLASRRADVAGAKILTPSLNTKCVLHGRVIGEAWLETRRAGTL